MPNEQVLSVQVHRQTSTLLDKCHRLAPVSVRGQGSIGMTTWDVVSVAAGLPAVATVQVQGIGFRCKS